jgi:arylsulfatase A-like enzyme
MAKTVRKLEDTATELSKEAVAFIDRHRDEPFFLYYPTTNIHFPLTPNARFEGRTKAGVYGEFVVEFDWAVSQVLDALKRNGIADRTVVVLTSDNGARPHESLNGHACNGPWRGTKRMIHEGGHRVPLIVRWPGRTVAGSVSGETVCLTDFMATFSRMLDRKLPEDAGEDSCDLSPVLFGEAYDPPLREATVHHSVSGRFAVRRGDWKLIEAEGDGDYPRDAKGKMAVKRWDPQRNPDTGRWEKLDYFELAKPDRVQLYNLAEDPGETRNLAENHLGKVRELRELLDRYRESGRSVPKR